MGTAALSDARSILSIAISHNMDNVDPIKQSDLAKYMGLTKKKDGTAADATTLNDAYSDASNSKQMVVEASNIINYFYRRGGVTLKGAIDVSKQKIEWSVSGVTAASDANRKKALSEGLKLASVDDLSESTAELWTTT